ncbi:hypothetical protein CrLKS3_g71 [Cylindrospermopsis phage Cr-LKS3]|nr:hypothetical protein CrLKS3_g71 [Cylindrospermopsis phage Cr-LKS3]
MNDPVSVRFVDVHDVQMSHEDYEAHCWRAWELMSNWLGQSEEFRKFGLRMELDYSVVACPRRGLSGWVYSDKLDMVPIRIDQGSMGMWPDTVEHREDMFLPIHFAATSLMDRIMGEIGRQLATVAIEEKADAE